MCFISFCIFGSVFVGLVLDYFASNNNEKQLNSALFDRTFIVGKTPELDDSFKERTPSCSARSVSGNKLSLVCWEFLPKLLEGCRSPAFSLFSFAPLKPFNAVKGAFGPRVRRVTADD